MRGGNQRAALDSSRMPREAGTPAGPRYSQRGAEEWRASAAHGWRRVPRARRAHVCQAEYPRHESGSGWDGSGCTAAALRSSRVGGGQPARARGVGARTTGGRRLGTAGGRGTVARSRSRSPGPRNGPWGKVGSATPQQPDPPIVQRSAASSRGRRVELVIAGRMRGREGSGGRPGEHSYRRGVGAEATRMPVGRRR